MPAFITAELDNPAPITSGAAGAPNAPTSSNSQSGSPVVNRYRDAYRVGAALVTLGDIIKICGGVLAAILILVSFNLGSLVVAGILFAAVAGGLFWVCGVIVSANGQVLRATLDTAVASSRFLSDTERAQAMGLPPSVVKGP